MRTRTDAPEEMNVPYVFTALFSAITLTVQLKEQTLSQKIS